MGLILIWGPTYVLSMNLKKYGVGTVLFLSSFSVRAAGANSGFFLRLFKHKLKRVATRLFSHKRRDMNILWEKIKYSPK